MRRKQLTVLLLLTAALTGCGGMGNTQKKPAQEETIEEETLGEEAQEAEAEETQTQKAQEDEPGNEAAAESGDETDGADGERPDILQGRILQGSMILEDEEAVYICGTERIRRIEKESGSSRILWEKSEKAGEAFFYMEGKALLIEDFIYFLEEGGTGAGREEKRSLSVIKTDGTGYCRVAELEDFPKAFYYCDNGLYLESEGSIKRYSPQTEGEYPLAAKPEEIYFEIPGAYTFPAVMQGGSRYLSALESVHLFGYAVLENEEMELVRVDPRTGEESLLFSEGHLRSFNRDYLLFMKYGEQQEELYLMDASSLEVRFLAAYKEEEYPDSYGIRVLDMDGDSVYVVAENVKEPSGETNLYEQIDLESGERRQVLRLDIRTGVKGSLPYHAGGAVIRDGYIYYTEVMDYRMYLMRKSLEEPEENAGAEELSKSGESGGEILGDAFLDTGIAQVGKVESYYEQIFSKAEPDFVLMEMDLERLVVDEKYEGAAKINRILSAYQDSIVSYGTNEEDINWREEEIAGWGEDEPPATLSYSCSSYPSEITYFDGDRFSFYQQDYDYTGGAHGMPLWVGFTFDLHTGQRLLLSDVIGNSEEELKEIVVRYFDACISEAPGEFWEDALTVVREGISLASDFYLEEEGICFYFPPYALAAYAGGFKSVTVPYEEFEMKIPVKK